MSIIGKIGELIVCYQYKIEALLLLILVAIIAWLIVRAVRKSRAQNDILKEINTKVESISDRIDHLEGGSAKNVPVVEEIGPEEEAEPEPESTVEPETERTIEPEAEAELETVSESTAEPETESMVESETETEAKTEPEAESAGDPETEPEFVANASANYARDRLSGTDKFGKTYTEEMLKEQIKL